MVVSFRIKDWRDKELVSNVHTNPFSNENGAVLLRIRLSSTLQRQKRSPKTEPFENALQSGAIWKRCFGKRCLDDENDVIWKRWRHQNRHDPAPNHSTVSIQNAHAWSSFDHAHWGYNSVSKQIRRCSLDGRKRYENDKCGRKSFWKRGKTAPFSFENGLVWTGPKEFHKQSLTWLGRVWGGCPIS